MRRLLLISNSTLHGRGYLDHVEAEIRSFLGTGKRVIFIPYALFDRGVYAAKARERFRVMGYALSSVHDVSNEQRAIRDADAIFIGGGNTFRLVKALHEHSIVAVIREKIASGTPYIGSSAGAIVAGPSLRTTKDMPVVQPPSFEALGLVSFQISPHYLDPDPTSTHMGETQEESISQFLEENDAAVIGLREGSLLDIQRQSVILRGPHTARVFRRGLEPFEAQVNEDLAAQLEPAVSREGALV